MDIGKKVTVTYQLKRGNYAVDGNDRSNINDDSRNTSGSNSTSCINGTNGFSDGAEAEASFCDRHIDEGQVGNRLLAEDSVQRISLPIGSEEQAFVSNWSLATNVGTSTLVSIQTSNGSTRICSTSIRILVRGIQVPSGKELVLTNESA
jgi:hypothetical protein